MANKTAKKIITGILMVLIIGVLTGCSFGDKKKDSVNGTPFAQLSMNQTRESVQKAYGTPTYSWDESEAGANMDVYTDVQVLGETGTLDVYYDADNLVYQAVITFMYPTEDEELHNMVSKLQEYYTEKYKEPRQGFSESLIWELSGDQRVHLTIYDDFSKLGKQGTAILVTWMK